MNLIVTSRLMANAALLASTLLTACGLRCTSPSTETFTVFEDAPMLKLLDLGTPGNSPGDVYHFFAPLHSTPGGTGKYMGARGQLTSTRNADGSYTQVFTLLK